MLGRPKKLQDLNLESCGIHSLPETFAKLSKLDVLNLSRCGELTQLPGSFGGLGNLRTLQLGYSGIESLLEFFGGLSLLENLDMTSVVN